MTTNQKCPTWGQVDRSIRGLKDEQENTLLPGTFAGHIERLVRIYAAIRPLLAMLAIVPFLPPTWRKAIDLFRQVLDDVAAGAKDPDGVSARFKAGRDL